MGNSSLLAKVDLLVPLSPDLGRSEHATRSAHVTESSLSSTVSSSSRDTRNTGNGTTCIDVELAIVIDLNASLPVPDLPTINMPSFSSKDSLPNASTNISSLSYLWERVGHTAGSAIGGQNGDSRT